MCCWIDVVDRRDMVIRRVIDRGYDIISYNCIAVIQIKVVVDVKMIPGTIGTDVSSISTRVG